MTNTMADLRKEVASRLRETLHGKEIDTMERGMPEVEHMLGIVPLGAVSTPKCEIGTLLDPDHKFWQEYEQDVNTKNAVKKKVGTAMKSLNEDDIFRVSEPYGGNGGIMYVEVGDVDREPNRMVTACAECGEAITTEPDIRMDYYRYRLVFELHCTECDFEQTVGRELHTQ